MKHVPLTVTAVCLIALCALPASAAAQEHAIKLTRPDKVGDKYDTQSEGAMVRRSVVTLNGEKRESPEEGLGAKLDGTIEVLAVTPKGRATKLSVTVRKCLRVEGAEETELVPPGSVIIAEAQGKGEDQETKFTLKDGDLAPEAAQALELLFHLSGDDARATDDEVFGTPQKQKAGGSWTINAERAAKDVEAEGVKAAKENVSGDLKLEAVETVDGVECLKLVGKIAIRDFVPSPKVAQGMPEGVKAERGSLEHRFDVMLPTDPTLQALTESFSARHQIVFAGKPGGVNAFQMEVTMQRAGTVKRKAVK